MGFEQFITTGVSSFDIKTKEVNESIEDSDEIDELLSSVRKTRVFGSSKISIKKTWKNKSGDIDAFHLKTDDKSFSFFEITDINKRLAKVNMSIDLVLVEDGYLTYQISIED